jgi:hypothetical protein
MMHQATQMTFDRPFEIPGNRVLPAGTYWFQIPSETDIARDVVEIFNADRTRIVASVETVPTERTEVTGRTELTFAEQSQNRPMALISWFYPGDSAGHEFVYSSSEESRLSESPRITTMVQYAPLRD